MKSFDELVTQARFFGYMDSPRGKITLKRLTTLGEIDTLAANIAYEWVQECEKHTPKPNRKLLLI
jgi:hypothetical protein